MRRHRDADDPTCRNAGLVIGGALVFVKIKIPYSKRFQVVGVATKQRLRPPPLLSLSLSEREGSTLESRTPISAIFMDEHFHYVLDV